MQRELSNNTFEEFIKCFRPFKRAAMMLIWPTVNMSLTPLLYRVLKPRNECKHFLVSFVVVVRSLK